MTNLPSHVSKRGTDCETIPQFLSPHQTFDTVCGPIIPVIKAIACSKWPPARPLRQPANLACDIRVNWRGNDLAAGNRAQSRQDACFSVEFLE
jgi:hypothetical protein